MEKTADLESIADLEGIADLEAVANIEERRHAQNGRWPMMSLPMKTLFSNGIG